jgi:hypothetical protein
MVPYIEIAEYRKIHSILVPLLEEAVGGHVFLVWVSWSGSTQI